MIDGIRDGFLELLRVTEGTRSQDVSRGTCPCSHPKGVGQTFCDSHLKIHTRVCFASSRIKCKAELHLAVLVLSLGPRA